MNKGFNDDDWFGEYARAIIKPGVFRTCEREECTCQLCGLSKTEKEFTESMWNNRSNERHSQRTLCFECSHPKCKVPECTTCEQCRNETCMIQFGTCSAQPPVLHWRELPKSLEAVENFKCGKCMPRKLTCSTCGSEKIKDAFTESAWHCRFFHSAVCIACTPTVTHACHLCRIEKSEQHTQYLLGITNKKETGKFSVPIASIRSAWRPHALPARTVGTRNAVHEQAIAKKSQSH